MCLFAMCIYSLMKYLLRTFAYFLIKLFVFSFLSFKSSLHTLDNSLLSDETLKNIFSKSMLIFFFFPFVFISVLVF